MSLIRKLHNTCKKEIRHNRDEINCANDNTTLINRHHNWLHLHLLYYVCIYFLTPGTCQDTEGSNFTPKLLRDGFGDSGNRRGPWPGMASHSYLLRRKLGRFVPTSRCSDVGNCYTPLIAATTWRVGPPGLPGRTTSGETTSTMTSTTTQGCRGVCKVRWGGVGRGGEGAGGVRCVGVPSVCVCWLWRVSEVFIYCFFIIIILRFSFLFLVFVLRDNSETRWVYFVMKRWLD